MLTSKPVGYLSLELNIATFVRNLPSLFIFRFSSHYLTSSGQSREITINEMAEKCAHQGCNKWALSGSRYCGTRMHKILSLST
jgi:hypothetical protein